jgi:glycyl-tRNA synthetase
MRAVVDGKVPAFSASHRVRVLCCRAQCEAGTEGEMELQVVGGTVPESDELLQEVANLVEAPTVLWGRFSDDFLLLPPALLVKTMRKHQRYFPVYSADGGELINAFVTVANGSVDVDIVRRGNEDVLRARFADASFFYNEDLKKPLESFLPALKGTMFHRELGSLFDKSSREVGLVEPVAGLLGLTDAAETAQQAARLAKADLATAVVSEMTSLAGVMGCHYAEKEGQPQVWSCCTVKATRGRRCNHYTLALNISNKSRRDDHTD